ncbi:MAG: helix-turn-helix domain-containing protein, partial [Solirubrobacteraceae bacterium]
IEVAVLASLSPAYPAMSPIETGRLTMADDDILTVSQVAAQFHVTPQTVRSWIDGGKLKGGRVGKAYVILRRDVYAMVEQAARRRELGKHAEQAYEGESELPEADAGASGPDALWTGSATATALVPPRSG